jgi:hypothetical protein
LVEDLVFNAETIPFDEEFSCEASVLSRIDGDHKSVFVPLDKKLEKSHNFLRLRIEIIECRVV